MSGTGIKSSLSDFADELNDLTTLELLYGSEEIDARFDAVVDDLDLSFDSWADSTLVKYPEIALIAGAPESVRDVLLLDLMLQDEVLERVAEYGDDEVATGTCKWP